MKQNKMHSCFSIFRESPFVFVSIHLNANYKIESD